MNESKSKGPWWLHKLTPTIVVILPFVLLALAAILVIFLLPLVHWALGR